MAINKKEIAEHAAEIAKYAAETFRWKLRAALRWADEVTPDIPPPVPGSRGLTKGFLYNSHSFGVEPACSSCTSYNFGCDIATDRRGTRSLYSTRLLALKGMRFAAQMEYAEKLLHVDTLIEAEKQAERLRNIDALVSTSSGAQE